MSDALEELLSRRLLIVTGKGGSGKTTVAATLAVLAAQRGIDTVLVDLVDGGDALNVVAKDPAAVPAGDGRSPVSISPHLSVLTIDPEVSVPIAAKQYPAATATPEPELEPPGVRSRT